MQSFQKNKDLLRIHDLVRLARDINAPATIIKACAHINPVYSEVRYPEGDELPANILTDVNFRTLLRQLYI